MRRRPERVLIGAVTAVLCAVVVAPLASIVFGLVPMGSSTAPGSPRELMAPFEYLLRQYGSWLVFSSELAVSVVGIGAAIAVPAAYVFVRAPFPGSRVLEELTMLPLSLPGIALSVALLAAYPAVRGPALVLGGHLLYTLPFMVRVVSVALRASEIAELEQAAQSLGASSMQRFLWIVLPQIRHAIVLGALLVFTVSWGEFNVSYLLNSGHPQTFPAALYNTYANESLARASAATVVFLAGVLPALGLIQLLDGDAAIRIEQGA